MPKYSVFVVQTYKVERCINMQLEAENHENAVESVASGAVEVPSFDAAWEETWDLQNEEVS
jgi:hypothetical protein